MGVTRGGIVIIGGGAQKHQSGLDANKRKTQTKKRDDEPRSDMKVKSEGGIKPPRRHQPRALCEAGQSSETKCPHHMPTPIDRSSEGRRGWRSHANNRQPMSDTALKLAPRSIATSSAVILSPEVAQMPREVATVVPRSSKPCTAYTAIGVRMRLRIAVYTLRIAV